MRLGSINKSIEEIAGLYVDQERPTASITTVYIRGGYFEIFDNVNYQKEIGALASLSVDVSVAFASDIDYDNSTDTNYYSGIVLLESDGTVSVKFADVGGDGYGGFDSSDKAKDNLINYLSTIYEWVGKVGIAIVVVQVIDKASDELDYITADDIYDVRSLFGSSFSYAIMDKAMDCAGQIYDSTLGSSPSYSNIDERFSAGISGMTIDHGTLGGLSYSTGYAHVDTGDDHDHSGGTGGASLVSGSISSGQIVPSHINTAFTFINVDADYLDGNHGSGFVQLTGNQTISGSKIFSSIPETTVIAQPAGSQAQTFQWMNQFVTLDTPQSISGVKTFVNVVSIGAGGVSGNPSVNINDNFIPYSSGTLNLGSSALPYKDAYITNNLYLRESDSALIFDSLSASSGKISADASNNLFNVDKEWEIPNQDIYFSAYKSTSITLTIPSHYYTLAIPEVLDPNNNYNGTIYTCPYDGIYLFNVKAEFYFSAALSSSTFRLSFRFTASGGDRRVFVGAGDQLDYDRLYKTRYYNGNIILPCVTGTQIFIEGYSSYGTPAAVNSIRFSGHLIHLLSAAPTMPPTELYPGI